MRGGVVLTIRRWALHWEEVSVFDSNASALGTNIVDLMAAAGSHLAREALAGIEMGGSGGEIWILCGPGNNGGDGFVAATLLHESGEHRIRVFASHRSQKTEISQSARAHAESIGIEVYTSDSEGWDPPPTDLSRSSLLVDCLLGVGPGGSGRSAEPRGRIEAVLRWMFNHFSEGAPRVLACDVPTGLGSTLQLNAGRTVTFHEEKLGMRTKSGEHVPGLGAVVISPLPWPEETTDPGPGDVLRYPAAGKDAIKGDRGRVLVVGGGPYHGAPLLAGMAATRMGADLIHVAMPNVARQRSSWPPEIIPEEIPDEDHLTMASLPHIRDRMKKGRGIHSLVIGPGLGEHEETLAAVKAIIEVAIIEGVPCVVDADAIKALDKGSWPQGMAGVATPHRNELVNWLEGADPHDVLSAAAAKADWDMWSEQAEDAVIITTGPIDQIIGLGGRSCRVSGGDSRMAMGGTGDLLAGCVGGLLAVGMAPWPAARLAGWLLRRAGEVAGEKLGPGMIASDIPPFLAGALATAVLKHQS